MTEHNGIVLGPNQYGKAEVRVVKVTRDTARHEIEDLNVSSQLRGDFTVAHTEGDNAPVVATDTQKNTIYALAKEGIGTPEAFLLRLHTHFTSSFEWVTGGRWEAEQYTWSRIDDHDHAFVRTNTATRTAVVVADDSGAPRVVAGLKELTVLKSTGSEFTGYPKDTYTTLQETTDRILATDVSARWRYNTDDVDYDAVYESVIHILLAKFAEVHSLALQQSLYEMGAAAIEAHPEIDEIRFSMPNKHHFLVDLSPFGLENPNEVFFAADRPYGKIEASVQREGAAQDESLWASVTGFC